MFRFSDGEEIMTLAFFDLIQYRSVTDGQTDGQTDGHLCSGYTSACIACYATALVKMADSFTVLVYLHGVLTFNTTIIANFDFTCIYTITVKV